LQVMASSTDSAPTRDQKVMQLRELIKENGEQAWELAWRQNTTPWDIGRMQPPLRELMESEEGKAVFSQHVKCSTEPRALVPGCGSGHDALFLASIGYKTTGIDLSETAVNHAESLHKSHKVKLSFEVADFFNFELPTGGYDLVYDYTFFCAIPPDLRQAWGARMRQLVRSQGHIITLVWPIDGGRTGGPPYSIDIDMVGDALNQGDRIFTKIYDATPTVSSEGHLGRERIAVWQRAED